MLVVQADTFTFDHLNGLGGPDHRIDFPKIVVAWCDVTLDSRAAEARVGQVHPSGHALNDRLSEDSSPGRFVGKRL